MQQAEVELTPAHRRDESGVTYDSDGQTVTWSIEKLGRTLTRTEVFDSLLTDISGRNLHIVGSCIDLAHTLVEYAREARAEGAKGVWLISNCAHLTPFDREKCQEALLNKVVNSIRTLDGELN